MYHSDRAQDATKALKQQHHKVEHSSFSMELTATQMVIAAVCLVLVLWLAYRIGKVILRLAFGLLFIGLVIYGIRYLFFR
jgi:hypothetical protein